MKIIITESKLKGTIIDMIKNLGLQTAIDLVGDFDSLVKVGFDGKLKEFYKFMNWVPYEISSDGDNMVIDKKIADSLNLPIRTDHWSGKERILGDFKYTNRKGEFTFNARLDGPIFDPRTKQHYMFVLGLGDEGKGFGYTSLYNKEKLPNKSRIQIFKQIIDKYNLDNYL